MGDSNATQGNVSQSNRGGTFDCSCLMMMYSGLIFFFMSNDRTIFFFPPFFFIYENDVPFYLLLDYRDYVEVILKRKMLTFLVFVNIKEKGDF